MRQLLRSSAVLLAATIGGSAIAADPAVDADRQPKTDPASTELPTIYVIGLTPTAGAEGDLRRYPGNAQVFGSDDMRDQQSRNLSRYLADNANGLHLADAANNPFQADLFYRGYSISPLLGLPQGLAVYQDGVRINEIFGDTVNWDLVPDDAIDRIIASGKPAGIFARTADQARRASAASPESARPAPAAPPRRPPPTAPDPDRPGTG